MIANGVTVEQLLSRLQFARLEHAAGQLDPGTVISGVATADDAVSGSDAQQLLVLGIGLDDPAAVARAWHRWSAAGAAALVVRTTLVDGQLEAPPGRTALLGLGPEMSWIRLAGLVSADVERSHDPWASGHLDRLDAGGADDEFYSMANALASLVDGPVTIEDLASRIIAFSADQDRADEHRKRSILERRVAQAHNAVLEEDGVFGRLYASPVPIFFQPRIDGARPRVAMRIRYGDDTLGSIWAVVDGPLSPLQEQGVVEASNVLALSIMRRRLLEDARRQEQHTLVEHLLRGGRDAIEAAAAVGSLDTPTFVIALTRRSTGEGEIEDEYHLRALAKVTTTYLSSTVRRAVVAPLGSHVYAVVPSGTGTAAPDGHAVEARRLGRHLVQRLGHDGVCLGIGDLVPDVSQLARSRRQAETAVRVLQSRPPGARDEDASYWRDLQVDALLLELADAMVARQEPLGAPFDRLPTGDPQQIATLRAYLDRFGDVAAAAGDVFVHPNTFRYRLRKLSERAELDLDDPDTRFALMLQLRLQEHRDPAGTRLGPPSTVGA